MKHKIIPEFLLIFGLLAVFIIGCIIRVIIALSTPSQLMADDYYQQSLKFDFITEAMNKASQLSMDMSFVKQPSEMIMTLADPQAVLAAGDTIQVKFFRPADKNLDRTHMFQVSNTNTHHSFTIGPDTNFGDGPWVIQMAISSKKGTLMLEKMVVL